MSNTDKTLDRVKGLRDRIATVLHKRLPGVSTELCQETAAAIITDLDFRRDRLGNLPHSHPSLGVYRWVSKWESADE